MLSVRHGARAVEFYKAAFGAVEVYRVEAPDGGVVSRLAVDGAEFWVADESPEHHNFSPESLGGGSRSEEHTSELQSRSDLVCRLLLEKKNGEMTQAGPLTLTPSSSLAPAPGWLAR